MIPKSMYRMQVFPTKLCLEHVDTKKVTEIDIQITGPIKNFIVICDLEKGNLRISGTALEGYFYYTIFATEESIDLHVKRCSKEGMTFRIGAKKHLLRLKETHSIIKEKSSLLIVTKERISFGNYKQQDFDKIKSRQDISEIIPLIMFYERYLPKEIEASAVSIPLLVELEKLMVSRNRIQLEQAILNVFNVHFDGILTCSFSDKNYLGLISSINSKENNTLIILKKFIDLLKKLFFHVEGINISILPLLPVCLHAGRYTGIRSGDVFASIEWSKKQIKKVELSSIALSNFNLHLQKEIKSYRVRKNTKEKGQRVKATESLTIPNKQILYLDQFEK